MQPDKVFFRFLHLPRHEAVKQTSGPQHSQGGPDTSGGWPSSCLEPNLVDNVQDCLPYIPCTAHKCIVTLIPPPPHCICTLLTETNSPPHYCYIRICNFTQSLICLCCQILLRYAISMVCKQRRGTSYGLHSLPVGNKIR